MPLTNSNIFSLLQSILHAMHVRQPEQRAKEYKRKNYEAPNDVTLVWQSIELQMTSKSPNRRL